MLSGRRFITLRAALLTPTVAVAAAIALATGQASAQPSTSTSAAAGAPAACLAGQLSISVPVAIPGDPAVGMGRQAWNIVFRNASSTSCSLRGWPRVTVHGSTGGTVATQVSNVRFSNLALVPDTRLVLRPGDSAVVTATSAANTRGCITNWALGLTLPGANQSVTVRGPGSGFAPCVGGQLRLSPFYPKQALTRDIKALAVSKIPPAFPVAAGREPPTCTATALRGHVASSASDGTGSVIVLRLGTASGTCTLPGDMPSVRLLESDGASPVAKAFNDYRAASTSRSVVSTYRRGADESAAVTLRPGTTVSVALVAAKAGTRACTQLNSVTIYPGAAAVGTGLAVAVSGSPSICGLPRALPFLPSSPAGKALTTANGALSAMSALSGTHGGEAGGDGDTPAGFWYGTDSSSPTACGSGPYYEPVGDCSRGTDGAYGGYMGMIGNWRNWQGCTTSGLAWNSTDYSAANKNVNSYNRGVGAAAYWFAAGPGRDPSYNGTSSEAYTWGKHQAERTVSDLSTKSLASDYVILDIETVGDPDQNGWNAVWNSACGGTVEATSVSSSIDRSTFNGFWDYIWNSSPYFIAAYSAGDGGYGSWSGIFGTSTLSNTSEWTFVQEFSVSNLYTSDFPSGFSNSYESAEWFGSAPDACKMLWQWEGGNGTYDGGYGDFDQIDGNRLYSCD